MTRVTAILATGVLLLAACGSDDDSQSDASEESAEPTDASTEEPTEAATEEPTEAATDEPTTEVADEPSPFCGDFIEAGNQVALADTGAADPEALVAAIEAALASAPEEIAADLEVMAAFAQSGGQGDFQEFDQASTNAVAWVSDNCASTSLEVTGRDYEYEGIPETAEAGIISITLTNEGTELHEAALLRVNDGVEATAEEILALPEEEAQEMVTFQGAVFTEPGGSGVDIFDLREPGNYIVACFIPVGATAEAAEAVEAGGPEPDGPPHFTQGMLAQITVE